MARESVDALSVLEDVVFIASFKRIAELALKQRLPSISFLEYPDAGGLFGYGANYLALYRRAPAFVDKILKGAKPGDIPIERPTQFEFVINMKTAKTLGLAISNATRLRADREIE
jgi:putative ABC transport system substrate-binding protein